MNNECIVSYCAFPLFCECIYELWWEWKGEELVVTQVNDAVKYGTNNTILVEYANINRPTYWSNGDFYKSSRERIHKLMVNLYMALDVWN